MGEFLKPGPFVGQRDGDVVPVQHVASADESPGSPRRRHEGRSADRDQAERVPGPRLGVNVESLGSLDLLVLRAQNPLDMEAAERSSISCFAKLRAR